MTTNVSGGLIGLSILSGTNSIAAFGPPTVETAAERAAEALFTTKPTVAPWQQPASSTTPDSTQLSLIQGMKTIIDSANSDESAGSDDVESSFIAYKALDRLRILADAASKPGMSDTQRAQLQTVFAKGLSDLQGFLAKAPGQLVNIAFGDPATSASSSNVAPTQDIGTAIGKGVVTDHTQPVPGVTGNEVLTISLANGSHKDSINVDLSTIATQPPSLDAIAKALNDAIASVAATDVNGNPILDGNGKPEPRYDVTFGIGKSSGTYGLVMDSDGTTVSMAQANGKDALVVVDSQTQFGTPTGAQVYRYDDPATGLVRQTIGNVSATDSDATAKAAAAAAAAADSATATTETGTGKDTDTTTAPNIPANLSAQASVTGKDGFTYVVGTTSGQMGAHLSDGGNDLFLTKLDSEGQVVWQQTLGVAGEAQGAAVSLAPDGSVVVAGSVTGSFDGNLGGNSDMLVAKFDASGAKQFATSIASAGDDTATAIAVGADGSIYLGGKSSGTGGGGAYVAHMDASGKMIQQRVIDGAGVDGVTAFAIDGSGNLLALTRENGKAMLRSMGGQDLTSDLGSVSLGTADARAIAVAADGSVAVVGATSTALPDNPSFPAGDGRDGFVTRIKADLSSASTTYIGGPGDDQLDSVAFMSGDLYVGGRTTSALDGPRRGTVDGFVGHLDSTTGAVKSLSQFGGSATVADAVHVTAASGGANVLGALGLHSGALNGEVSTSLSSQSGLEAGDSFSFQIDGGVVKKISIDEGETLGSLQQKIRLAGGTNIVVTAPKDDDTGTSKLQILVQPGHTVGLMAGPAGQDALAKLGIAPTRLRSDAPRAPKAPLVTPGGTFGLSLNLSLDLGSATDAKTALDAITSAISMTQTAYRSLYWDSGKAAQANGPTGAGTARQQAQLASYQAALQRLSSGTNGLSML